MCWRNGSVNKLIKLLLTVSYRYLERAFRILELMNGELGFYQTLNCHFCLAFCRFTATARCALAVMWIPSVHCVAQAVPTPCLQKSTTKPLCWNAFPSWTLVFTQFWHFQMVRKATEYSLINETKGWKWKEVISHSPEVAGWGLWTVASSHKQSGLLYPSISLKIYCLCAHDVK